MPSPLIGTCDGALCHDGVLESYAPIVPHSRTRSLRALLKTEPRGRSEALNAAILRTLAFTPAAAVLCQLPTAALPPIVSACTLQSLPPGAPIAAPIPSWSLLLSGSLVVQGETDAAVQPPAKAAFPIALRAAVRHADTAADAVVLTPGDSVGAHTLLGAACTADHTRCTVRARFGRVYCVFVCAIVVQRAIDLFCCVWWW